MARLNEGPHSADSYDTLRRKLLRQNRELARVNSSQSLRIRHLENECARMLSENLELRGHILQLEGEVENSKAQRVADHALEIRARLEAQLVEWGSLLAGLGLEPPVKRRDGIGRRASQQARGSFERRSPGKSLRDLAREAEARARDEGRLTPISEHKSYPRRSTLDAEEIMALRNEAIADISGSSDIGPPPTSRFAEPDSPQREPDSPTRRPQEAEETPESVPESPIQPPSPEPAVVIKEEVEQEADSPPAISLAAVPQAVEPQTVDPPAPQVDTSIPQDTQAEQPVRTGSKRKLAARDAPVTPSGPTTTTTRRKPTILKDRAGGRTLKELAAMRREEKGGKQVAAAAAVVAAPVLRKPLGAKSTNDDLASPKKAAAAKKCAAPDKPVRPVRMRPLPGQQQPRDPEKRTVAVLDDQTTLAPASASIRIVAEPDPEKAIPTTAAPPPVADLEPDSNGHSENNNSPSPTPEPRSQVASRDTPPPADISSLGETSRPSRRVRAQVSYAEPNLRDKMRRPTKELVDAVAVAGGDVGRASESLTAEEMAGMMAAVAAAAPAVKHEPGVVGAARCLADIPPAPADSSSSSPSGEQLSRAAAGSPAARKGVGESLPSSVVTERRKRRSSVLAREAVDVPAASIEDCPDSSLSSTHTLESSSVLDVYDFPDNSPGEEAAVAAAQAAAVPAARRPNTRRASSRASHADLGGGEEGPAARPSRKRASINGPRRSRQEVSGEGVGESACANGASDHSMRRRSTML